MTERVKSAWTAWKRYPFARKLRLFGYAVLLIAAVELVVVSAVYDRLLGFWQSFLVNFGTDALGVAITVLILNALQERAQKEQLKQQLSREMSSSIRDVAIRAVEEVRARGWLQDGTMEGVNLSGAHLQDIHLEGMKLPSASLVIADLRGAHLEGVILQGANLWIADLRGADLWAAELQGAYLAGADLRGADLRAANLQDAILNRAKLQGARLERATLLEAVYNNETLWPDGYDPKAAGAINVNEGADPSADTEGQIDG